MPRPRAGTPWRSSRTSTATSGPSRRLAEEQRHPELLQLFRTRLVEPRRALLETALAAGVVAGELPDPTDLDAVSSMLIGSFYGRYVTVAGIPDDWPTRILDVVWPRPAPVT